jgi:hypothetical protein
LLDHASAAPAANHPDRQCDNQRADDAGRNPVVFDNGGDRSTEDRLIEIIKAYNYLKTVVRGAT